MTHPVIGWGRETAVPAAYLFTDYLLAKNGRLHFRDIDLAELMLSGK